MKNNKCQGIGFTGAKSYCRDILKEELISWDLLTAHDFSPGIITFVIICMFLFFKDIETVQIQKNKNKLTIKAKL